MMLFRFCEFGRVGLGVGLGLAMLGAGQAQGGGTGATVAPGGSRALASLLKEMWEDELKHSPEFASQLGDRRYGDQLKDLSPRAVNDALAREQGYLVRLAEIDTSGLSGDEKLSAETLEERLAAEADGARAKAWEMPVTPTGGVQTELPRLAEELPFETVKDYDDWIARMKKIPDQIRQATENMMAGIDDRRVQPAALLLKAEKQAEEIAGQKPEATVFAQPLSRFPATVSAAERKRITEETLNAIQDDIQPAYGRFARFLKVQAVPAGAKDGEKVLSVPSSEEALEQARILELRAKAKAALGNKFNGKAFADLMENDYSLPGKVLEERVSGWVSTMQRQK